MLNYRRPDWFTKNIFNPAVAGLTKLGLPLAGSRVLAVRGRKSGEWRTTPVNPLTLDGQRYLVAPRGHTQWVRNLRVSGAGELRLGRKTEEFVSQEVPDSEKVPILRGYLKHWKWEAGMFFDGKDADSPDAELQAIAPGHPVFRISPPPERNPRLIAARAPVSFGAMEEDGARANHTTIRDLPAADRPRERLRDFGANALSLAELIAILLRTGTAQQSAIGIAQDLLSRYSLNDLVRAPFRELCNIPGLGEAKAAQLKAALELGVRAAAEMGAERASYSSPDDIARAMMPKLAGYDQEVVHVLLLDNRNRSLGEYPIYKGSVHSAQVRLSELLRDAVRVNAPHMVLVHNHPSGDPTPSAADIHMTKLLYESAKVMDIDLTDHLIIGGGRYISMKAVKMGFPNGA